MDTTYNLLDKERTWRIIGCKVMSIMFLCITVILFIVATLFNHVIFYIASLSALVFLIFLITHLVLKKILGRKISFSGNVITVYSYGNKKIREHLVNEMYCAYIDILFNEYRSSFDSFKCLVFYKDIEVYNEMEYQSYWYEPNMLIVQNPVLIEKLLEHFNIPPNTNQQR